MKITDISDPSQSYTSPKGRPFRTYGIERVPNTRKGWGNKEQSHWKVCIQYLDNLEREGLVFDYNDKLIRKEKPCI